MNARDFTYIYCVCDPVRKQVRYVGKTLAKPLVHVSGYMSLARKNNPLYSFNQDLMDWFRALDTEDIAPMVVTLEKVRSEVALGRESLWTRYFLRVGEPLLNKRIL